MPVALVSPTELAAIFTAFAAICTVCIMIGGSACLLRGLEVNFVAAFKDAWKQ